MEEDGRARHWRASLDSRFDHCDGILPSHSLGVCTGRVQEASMNAPSSAWWAASSGLTWIWEQREPAASS